MLTDRERDELLIRLDERMTKVRNDQKELKEAMASDEGFTRCQLHNQRMESIERSTLLAKRSAVAAVVAIIGKIAWEYIHPMFPG